MKNIFLIIFVVMGLSAGAMAGVMTSEVDKNQSTLDEPFWMTVTIQGSLDGDVKIPDSEEFEITRTGESTNISIMNGSISKERQYSYQVRALKEGKLTIPSLKAKVDGQELQTLVIPVEVKGGVAPPSTNDVKQNKKLVFVERELPKSSVYEGESIVTKVRLMTRARLTGATPARDAAPDWRLIPVEGQRETEVTRDGTRWHAIELTEALIPLRTGKLKAPPFGITASWIQPTARRKGNPQSLFDMFQHGAFNAGEEVTKKLVSDPVEVLVKPLPAPKPPTFSDMVGAFTVRSTVSKREISSGETATVTVEFKGQGALDRMKDLKLNIPGTRVYPDKPSLTEKVEAGAGLISTRVLKFAVVPSRGGQLDLGTFKITSFNPFSEQYEDLEINLGSILVKNSSGAAVDPAGNSGAATGQNSTDKQDIDVPVKNADVPRAEGSPQLPQARTVDDASLGKRPWFLSPLGIALEILLICGLIAVFLIMRGFRRFKSRQSTADSGSSSKEWQMVLSAIDSGDISAVDMAIRKLKSVLVSPGQDPASLTSLEMIKSAELNHFDPEIMAALRRLLAEMDRREYRSEEGCLDPALFGDMRQVIVYCQSRGS